MEYVFVDTLYWIAFISPNDQWHKPAHKAYRELGNVPLVTTEAVLIEFLARIEEEERRQKSAQFVDYINQSNNIIVERQTKILFDKALEFYKQRKDKTYSFTDCISMVVMKKRNINKILTHDKHFEQEGFETLIKMK